MGRNEFARLSAEQYHADPAPPSLSASIAHALLAESPAHAFLRHPTLGGVARPGTKATDRGTLLHRLILDEGPEVAVIAADDFKSRVAREARDAALAAGKFPVLAKELERATVASEALKSRFGSLGLSIEGEREITALWTERTYDGEEVQCRGMIDLLAPPRVIDLKSIRSAHPDFVQRQIEDYGYAVQRAAYVSAVEKLLPEHAGRLDFVLVFYETEPPYAVTPVRLSGAFRALGERRWQRAVDMWSRCLRERQWPGYVRGIIDIEPPGWVLAKDFDARDYL